MHCSENRATLSLFTLFEKCTVCEKMLRELSSLLSASNRSKQAGGFGGDFIDLHSIIQDLQRAHNDIEMSHKGYGAGGFGLFSGSGLLKP